MQFKEHKFSARFPAVACSLFIIHEPVNYKPCIEYDPRKDMPNTQAAKYRGTAAAIILPDGRYWVGVCLCSPNDAFVKKVGRAKATGRAFQSYRLQAHPAPYVTFLAGKVEWNLADLKSNLQIAIDTMKREKGIL